jgi:hypothetical protein
LRRKTTQVGSLCRAQRIIIASKTSANSCIFEGENEAAGTTSKAADKADDGDVDMKDATETTVPVKAPADTPSTRAKPANEKRKSTAGSPEKGKKLSKKASKAQLLVNAKPGGQFLVKLKGYPLWPAIIIDEAMMPESLLKSRPVTAARPDGTFHENYAEGGKRMQDRTFPVMYYRTHEL